MDDDGARLVVEKEGSTSTVAVVLRLVLFDNAVVEFEDTVKDLVNAAVELENVDLDATGTEAADVAPEVTVTELDGLAEEAGVVEEAAFKVVEPKTVAVAVTVTTLVTVTISVTVETAGADAEPSTVEILVTVVAAGADAALINVEVVVTVKVVEDAEANTVEVLIIGLLWADEVQLYTVVVLRKGL